jgi:hypothetical protein
MINDKCQCTRIRYWGYWDQAQFIFSTKCALRAQYVGYRRLNRLRMPLRLSILEISAKSINTKSRPKAVLLL